VLSFRPHRPTSWSYAHEGARSPPQFDYGDAEWTEIEAAVQGIRKGPLPKKARELLCVAASVYIWEMARPQHAHSARELKKKWHKIAGSSKKLYGDLSDRIEELLCEINLKGPLRGEQSTTMVYLEAISLHLSMLPTIANRAADYLENQDDKSNPRLRFQSKILEIWVRLGGKLQISRHPKTQEIRGPLARFFFAVARPVMGTGAPSPDSLRDIVERQKTRMVEIDIFPEKPAFSLLALYDRLREWIERDAEKHHSRLALEFEITRTMVGPDHPAVVAADRMVNGEKTESR
jgi:hypothetical protein